MNKVAGVSKPVGYENLSEEAYFQSKTGRLLKKAKENGDWALERKSIGYSLGDGAIAGAGILSLVAYAIDGTSSRCNRNSRFIPGFSGVVFLDNVEKRAKAQRELRGKFIQMADWYKQHDTSTNGQNLAKSLETIVKTAKIYAQNRDSAALFLAITCLISALLPCHIVENLRVAPIGLAAASAFATLFHFYTKNQLEETIRQNVDTCLSILEKENSLSAKKA